jgi:hypothetical protein
MLEGQHALFVSIELGQAKEGSLLFAQGSIVFGVCEHGMGVNVL